MLLGGAGLSTNTPDVGLIGLVVEQVELDKLNALVFQVHEGTIDTATIGPLYYKFFG